MRFQVQVHRLAEEGRTITGGQDCSLICANAARHERRPLTAAFKHLAHKLNRSFCTTNAV